MIRWNLTSFLIIAMVFPLPPIYPQNPENAPQLYDYVISGAQVFTGRDQPAAIVDIALKGDRISALGKIAKNEAKEWIDASGLWAAPGLIDTHTHSDFNPLLYPGLPNKVTQGVTTEVVGNCGMSAAPIEGSHRERIKTLWAREGVQLPDELPWNSVSEYSEVLQKQGMLTNLQILVGHGNLRSAVMGFRQVKAEQEDLLRMKELLREAMDQGARGLSFGLVYLPGIFADSVEIEELCKVVAEKDGVCAFHMRSEGSSLVESVKETLEVARATGVRVEISHLKASGEKNWPKIKQVFEMIEEARSQGLKVRADAYPYTAGFAELGVVLPDSLFTRADRNQIFQDPAQREKLIHDLEEYYEDNPRNWNQLRVASVAAEKDKPFQGFTIADIARKKSLSEVETLVALLADSSFEVSAFNFSQKPEIVESVLEKPYVSLGSDSIADGIDVPHPRAYGSFPTFLRREIDKDPERAGELFARLSTEPADFFGLEGRGRIQAGYYADIVLVDPAKVRSEASYDHPKRLSQGIEWVFINGRPAVARGVYTGEKPGRVLDSRLT